MTQFSVRTVPWMKLGRLVDSPKTAAEAAELGGLNFEVEKRNLFYDGPNGTTEISDRKALVRKDTNEWLSIMSTDYPILQYSEAFDFLDGINPKFVAAGVLQGGRQGFMVVESPYDFNVLGGEDEHQLYAVLRTSHDGSRAVEVMVMPLRNRCMNQLTLQSFSSGVPHRWAVKHTSSMQKKLQDAHNVLENLSSYAKAFEKVADRLVKLSVDDDGARKVLTSILPNRPKREDQITRIIDIWHTSDTVGYSDTGWGLVNAVSEYFDWQRAGGSPQSRFIGALQGQTYTTINRVAGYLLSRN
jgi:phage/plasmid-like protein (TIGR03299 family)